MMVRDLERGVITAVDPMGEILEREGVVSIRTIGEATVKLMRAQDVYRITAGEMKRDPHLLYQIRRPAESF
jgi:aminoglycoside N3'-acetyltransferase